MDFILPKLLTLPGIIIALTVHEFAHAKVAYELGDSTAQREGRVTLNPLAHIDWIGMLCLILVGFGWGKPVPVNSNNLRGKHRKLKEVAISSASVIANFILALLCTILMVFLIRNVPGFSGGMAHTMLYGCMYINVILMIFNLIPLPPLDGFNIVAEITGFDETPTYYTLLHYGSFVLLLLVITNIISYILTPGIDAVITFTIHIASLIFGM